MKLACRNGPIVSLQRREVLNLHWVRMVDFGLNIAYQILFVAVWAETGEFRDSGHSSLASGGSNIEQSSLYAPPRPRRDRKNAEDSEYTSL